MKVGIKVMPRKEVLDTQGRTVQKTLEHHGQFVKDLHVGKYIQLDFDTSEKDKALAQAQEIAELILYNPLIETYEVEVIQ